MSDLSVEDVLDFPAKTTAENESEQGGTIVPGISVLQHGCLAAGVLGVLLHYVRFQRKDEILPKTLRVLAALHDVGKVNPYFLKKLCATGWKDGGHWEKLASDALPDGKEAPHAIVSAALLVDMEAPDRSVDVVAAHHGYEIESLIPPHDCEKFGGSAWAAARKLLADEILRNSKLSAEFPKRCSSRKARATQLDLWKGWIVLADWIASREGHPIPKGSEADRAAELVKEAGFRELNLQNAKTFEEIFKFSPRSAQSLLVENYTGPGIYVLEAPTGCGKTEAALGLAFKALQNGDASGIYFALPTQLTSNRVHDRVEAAVSQFLDESADVRLTHSGARLMNIRMGKEAAPGEIWYSSSRLALLSPFGVGTVDQALLSLLNTKFRQVRLVGLCGKVVILDEIHSYDAYTLELIAKLVRVLEAMGAVVVILSATLTHEALQKILGEESLPRAKNVVSLTVKTKDPIKQFESAQAEPHPVAVKLLENEQAEDEALREALRLVRSGMQVLWIENTVDQAQKLYERVKAEGVTCGLLHSRFRVCDREVNENNWTQIFGKDGHGSRRDEGRILIGTQVLEQSLDLDADFMVTRLAPIDLLIQRFGRLWRHASTPRPAECNKPRAWILAVPENSAPSAGSEGGLKESFGKTGKIYHPYILHRTLEILRERLDSNDVLRLPDEVRSLLEAVFKDREEENQEVRVWKNDLLKRQKEMIDYADGALSLGHMQDENNAATRMMSLPSYEVIVLSAEDRAELADCRSKEEIVMALERRIVKSLKPLGAPASAALSECVPSEFAAWFGGATRFKTLTVAFCDAEGELTEKYGSSTRLNAKYTQEVGLKICR